MKAIVILSGGLDSTTLLYMCQKKGLEIYPLTFDYGQKHKREIEMAKLTCKKLGFESVHKIIDISQVNELLSSSLTTKDIQVPYGHYEEESMKQTVVPARNAIFLSIAFGYGYSIKAELVAIGAHAGDHAIYPDCREAFFQRIEYALNSGNSWFAPLRIYHPFLDYDKGDIVRKGIELEVDYRLTHTCYEGQEKPCMKCGSCIERKQAFEKNNLTDPLL